MKDSPKDRVKASKLLEKNVKNIISDNYFRAKGYRTLAELAKAIGISAPSLTHALKGNPRLETIQKIADTLGVSVESLFKESDIVKGTAIIDGITIMPFNNIEELEQVLAEAKGIGELKKMGDILFVSHD